MRYLLFNLVVFAALAYLAVGNGTDPRAWLADVTAAPPAVERAEPIVEPLPSPKVEPVKQAAEPEPVVETPPPLPPTQVVAQIPVHEVPIQQTEVPQAPVETATFMSPTERRRELARLIDDMEGRFLDRLGN
ncbi:hypothetical protein JCM17960_00370 [Magnetospira thiophila]